MGKIFISLIALFASLNNISQVCCFVPMVQERYLTHITDPVPPSLTPTKSFLPFYQLSQDESINHFSEKANHLSEEFGKNIVLSVSSGLPKFDTVGHKILSANHDFIANILDNSHLSGPMKKSIILVSIKLAQMGDDMGSLILQQYYNLVEKCL